MAGVSVRDCDHTVEGEEQPLDRLLRHIYPDLSWKAARRMIDSGKVSIDGQPVRNVRRMVPIGTLVSVRMATPRAENTAKRGPRFVKQVVLHLDSQLVVVAKPPGLLSALDDNASANPGSGEGALGRVGGAQMAETLAKILQKHLPSRSKRRRALGVVQRLDRDTSGVMVFARTGEAREHLKAQFKARSIERSYRALASGRVKSQTIDLRLIEQRDGKRRAVRDPNMGIDAVTHVKTLSVSERASFIHCKLETGRTHQIRIHLAAMRHPLLGDARYARADVPTLREARNARVMLHASELGLTHPTTEQEMRFVAPLPPDMLALMDALGLKE